MRFIVGCVGFSIIILLGFISLLTYNGKGFNDRDHKKRVKIITKEGPGNKIIIKRDLIVFNTIPKIYAFAGSPFGNGIITLRTSVDSIVSFETDLSWARGKFKSFDSLENTKSNFKYRGSSLQIDSISSLFESKYIHELYREKDTLQDINNALSIGIVSAFLALFLLAYFIFNISASWPIGKRIALFISVFFIVFFSIYARYLVGLRIRDPNDLKGIVAFHSLHWLLYGIIILTMIRFKSNFMSRYTFQGVLFLIIVFSFPFAHFATTVFTPGLYEGYRNSLYYHGLYSSLVTITEYSIASLGIGLANFAVFAFKDYKEIEQSRKSALQEQLKTKEQLNSLSARLNPHFLYNSLNSIAGLINQNPVKAEEMTLAVSRFLKHFSNRKEEHVITVREELDVILDYISIEKIRFGDKLSFSHEVDEEVLDEQIPRSVLQPLVENAVKYGYSVVDDRIEVKLIIKRVEKQLVIQVYDSGKPFDNALDKGYGISSVYNKLDLLYKDNYTLEFVNEPEKYIEIIIASDKLLPIA